MARFNIRSDVIARGHGKVIGSGAVHSCSARGPFPHHNRRTAICFTIHSAKIAAASPVRQPIAETM